MRTLSLQILDTLSYNHPGRINSSVNCISYDKCKYLYSFYAKVPDRLCNCRRSPIQCVTGENGRGVASVDAPHLVPHLRKSAAIPPRPVSHVPSWCAQGQVYFTFTY